MAVVAHADNKRMYSWWWDSHISPKNSKWLQENLTDMDAKVKQMIKVIEEDADSFARRAEMYYKKRPELMKLVEEFYRAYRALAERYDHATGVIRHAHRTMEEAFPNQVPAMFMDDSPAPEVEPRTPEMTPIARAMFEPDELQKDALGLSSYAAKRNGTFTDESDTIPRRKGFKQLNDSFGSGELRARKGLRFHNVEDSDDSDLKARVTSESDLLSKAEMEMITLKKSLARLEAEKEAGLIQYHQSLERLSNLEKEVVRAQEGSRGLQEHAIMAEAEVQNLKGALAKLEAEREASLAQYEQCLEKISHLENSNFQAETDVGELNERASKAEIEAQSLKQDLDTMKDEKEAALSQYMQCLDKISNLEEKMLRSEENAERMKERAERAEKEVETLKQAVAELMKEKEAAAVQYQQCSEKIASLEQQIGTAEEEEERLKSEILDGVAKLQDAEERCTLLERSNQSLHTELESLVQKTTAQSQELTEKQKELGRLWASIQEERLRFVEAETAFQTLQHLHSQSQEDLRSLATELQNRAQVIQAIESRNQSLENEVQMAKEENKSLNELNLSSEVSIKNLQEEILNLRETIRKLEAEVELRVDQRNALQQEIYCLKEELNDINKRYQEMTAQVESVGLNPECFESSMKDLQEENIVLKEASQRDRDEKSVLLDKLRIMEELIEKNALLENSLSVLNVELVSIREKVKALEDSCQSLSDEKSSLALEKDKLMSQLHISNENWEKLSEKNNLLENSLLDANAELETVKVMLQSLENSCLLLADEKSNLFNEREGLVSELEISQKRQADADKLCAELKENCMSLEEQRDSAVEKAKDLENSLDTAKKELTSFAESTAVQLAALESQVRTLEAENQFRKEEYEEEVDRVLHAEIEIFIFRECMQDLEEKNISLSAERRKLLESSTLSKKLIAELEHENRKRHADINFTNVQIESLRIGLHQVLKITDIDMFSNNDNKTQLDNKAEQDKQLLHHILTRLREICSSLSETQDENHELAVENAVLIAFLAQLKEGMKSLAMEKHAVQQELRIQSTQFLELQNESQKLTELGEELRSKVTEGGCREEAMETEMQHLGMLLQELQKVYQTLLTEKSNMLHENRSLGEEKSLLEEENTVLFSEAISQSNTCLIFKEVIAESSKGIKQLSGDLEKLSCLNGHLEEKVKNLEKQILKLSGDYSCQYKETESICQTNIALESELVKLREELGETKHREEEFHQEVKNTKIEVELWEKEAALLFGEQQVLGVYEKFLEEKAYELAGAYEHLAKQCTSQSLEVDQLKDRVNTLKGENEGLKAQLKAYAPAVTSLNNSLASLESHIVLRTNGPTAENDEAKGVDPGSELSASKYQQTTEEEMASVFDVFSDLQSMPKRVETVTKTILEMERLAVFEKLNAALKLEAAMRQIEELKFGSSSRHDSFRAKKHANGKQEGYNDPKMQRPSQEICEEGNEVTKDIMLDQVSECSSYGISRRETAGDDQMLELWETTEYDGSINMKVGKPNNKKAVTAPSDYNQTEAVKTHKGKNPSADSLVKDLGIDSLEISSRFVEAKQEASQRKILDRLDSDAQKLTNLQITVVDLKRKVDFTEKGKKVKGIEYGTVKEQLEEAEEAITKLFSANHKLITHIEDGSLSYEDKSTTEPDEVDGVRKRKIAEQARRLSEKIGRLQLEVQKIQFLLMKLNDEKESKGKLRIAERKTSVLLRDYLYGGGIRTGQRRKTSFCSCVEPPTRGD